MSGFYPEETWSCHICGVERPDGRIAVYRRTMDTYGGQILGRCFTENIRYCNDNPACTAAARDFSFLRTWGNGHEPT